MGFVALLKENVARLASPRVAEVYRSALAYERAKADYLQENVSNLQLELENMEYRKLTNVYADRQFSPDHVMNIVRLSMQMAVKNPITVRSINVQADYVFGQGVSFVAKHPMIQQVIDEFVDYRENRISLTSHTAMLRAEKRQQVSGSMFFALNTNVQTGRVIVRNLPTLEVHCVICDPNDREKEWYIKRFVHDASGATVPIYHPAYGITQNSVIPQPWAVNKDHDPGEILWNAPVLHVACNRLGTEEFALPEVYPQLDWAISYKRSLEQWISIIASYARMAMKISGLGGKKQAAAAKSLLNTTVNSDNPFEGNPSAVSGSTALLGRNVDVQPVKTAGATTPASDADPILNFAGCAVGLPNTFFGDAGKGNFATAKTLDRPTELKMISRQKLWMEIFRDILEYVVQQSAIAPDGILALQGATYEVVPDVFTNDITIIIHLPNNTDPQFGSVGVPIDVTIDVHFPEVLERNVADRVRSLVNATTLFGKPLTDIIPDKRLVAKLLLQALNVPNAESYIPSFMAMWAKNMNAEPGEPVSPEIIPPPDLTGGSGAEDAAQGGAVGDNG